MSGWAPPPKPDTTVWVTHRFSGFHQWLDAPISRSYLSSLHRHVFHVRVEIEVGHDDREIEFHDLLDVVVEACGSLGHLGRGEARMIGQMSCEQIARSVLKKVESKWTARWIRVDASEDGENGASVGTPVVSADSRK